LIRRDNSRLSIAAIAVQLQHSGVQCPPRTKKKTYNNVVSAVRTAFKFGYQDLPGKFNPALALPTFRISKKERPKVDPFTLHEAETIIAASHTKWG